MLQPTDTNVLILPDEAETVTSFGLVLPPNAQEKPATAIVKAVGPKALDLEVGDKVIFEKYAGASVTHDGVDYIILPATNILVVVTD